MKFSYFQAFGMVIFNKAFFKQLQANTEHTRASLEKQVKELQEKELIKIKDIRAVAGVDELEKRIETLQQMVKDERALRERAEADYDLLLSSHKKSMKSKDRTITSSNFLIRDLLGTVQDLRRKVKGSDWKYYKTKYEDCAERVSQVKGVIRDFKADLIQIPKPANNTIKEDKKEIKVQPTNKVDCYA